MDSETSMSYIEIFNVSAKNFSGQQFEDHSHLKYLLPHHIKCLKW